MLKKDGMGYRYDAHYTRVDQMGTEIAGPQEQQKGKRKQRYWELLKMNFTSATFVKAFFPIKKDDQMLKPDTKRAHLTSPILHLKIAMDGGKVSMF